MPTLTKAKPKSRPSPAKDSRPLLIAGGMEYTCIPSSTWEQALDQVHASGINCIACRVPWNLHEPEPNRYDFSGQADLSEFLRLVRQRRMGVILGLGPYCGDEFNFGGLPYWLREIPVIALRTWNAPYMERVERYFRVLSQILAPHLASHGNDPLFIEIEEGGATNARRSEASRKYLSWLPELLKSVGITAPVRDSRWLELPATATDPYQAGYEILRFIADGGGSGLIYRHWHGGTLLGRMAGHLQPTGVGIDAPINAWSEPTSSAELLSELHAALHSFQAHSHGAKPQKNQFGREPGCFSVSWKTNARSCAISINSSREPNLFSPAGAKDLLHPAASACLWERKQGALHAVWKSWPAPLAGKVSPPVESDWKPIADAVPWLSFVEPKPSHRKNGTFAPQPIEQLTLTRDATDFCWYSTEVQSTTARRAQLRIDWGGDYLSIFVNGRLASQTRGPLTGHAENGQHAQTFSIPLNHGQNRIEILASALGLPGDSRSSTPLVRKGIWGPVHIDDKKLIGWQHHPALVGETLRPDLLFSLDYQPLHWSVREQIEPLTWYSKEFELTPGQRTGDTAWAFDAAGMDKGALWLNGHAVARIWPGAPAPEGQPTHRYYLVPSDWLATRNRLVIFSESGAKPQPGALICRPRRTEAPIASKA
jgi:beta-galactosidase